MKQKLLYIIFAVVVLTTTTGFGFLESSTIMHGREHRQFKSDSLKNTSNNLPFPNNPLLSKKEAEKPVSNQITKSFIQWVANLVKNTLQIVFDVIVDSVRVILVAIIKFLIG